MVRSIAVWIVHASVPAVLIAGGVGLYLVSRGPLSFVHMAGMADWVFVVILYGYLLRKAAGGRRAV